jgi:hypothetical protein
MGELKSITNEAQKPTTGRWTPPGDYAVKLTITYKSMLDYQMAGPYRSQVISRVELELDQNINGGHFTRVMQTAAE